ncbi:MAG: hypothetical protein ACJ8M4_07075 [Chthoniobacterales bacterium]
MTPVVAFLSQGKLHLSNGSSGTRMIPSAFGETVRERALRMEQKNAWKTQGSGAQFMNGGMAWGARGRDPAEMRIEITGLTRGATPSDLIYSLDTDDLAGVFLLRDFGAEEQRLFHSIDRHVCDLNSDPAESRLACAVKHNNGIWNIGVMSMDGSGLSEATEGDSVDRAPSWIPGRPDEIVFQSAGIGRDRNGVTVGVGAFHLETLNIISGEMTCVADDPQHDLLAPRFDQAGNLFFIRRPHHSPNERPGIGRGLLDFLLAPFRILLAIYHWLNFFTFKNSGQPLNTQSGNARRRQMDLRKMVIYGNLVNVERTLKKEAEEESPSLVPKSWELVCQPSSGEESVIARGVLAFDLAPDGTIIHTNGSVVFRETLDRKSERLIESQFIEHVVACA